MKAVALFLATTGGAGLAPIAPGTFGSAVGIVVYLLTRHWPPAWQLGLLVAVSLVGIWAAGVAERHYGREDPGAVVIDEVAGQLATLLLTGAGIGGAVLGFFLFRVLDIIKPWPARQFEALHGGTGIMADDLMAGVYGNLLMRLALFLLPALAG
ncbi:MAG: phosphatidylglycerophosphatase A [Vicinamibacterales bacterium]